jgi:hypothetical protein
MRAQPHSDLPAAKRLEMCYIRQPPIISGLLGKLLGPFEFGWNLIGFFRTCIGGGCSKGKSRTSWGHCADRGPIGIMLAPPCGWLKKMSGRVGLDPTVC